MTNKRDLEGSTIDSRGYITYPDGSKSDHPTLKWRNALERIALGLMNTKKRWKFNDTGARCACMASRTKCGADEYSLLTDGKRHVKKTRVLNGSYDMKKVRDHAIINPGGLRPFFMLAAGSTGNFDRLCFYPIKW